MKIWRWYLQGVPRYVTAEKESRSDRLVRRGLAFIIEHGFYKTDMGRQHYLMNLRQIVDSVNADRLSRRYLRSSFGQEPLQRVGAPAWCYCDPSGQLLRQQRRRWGCIQKQERGLYLLDAELKDQLKYEGVQPDVWILPSKMSIYVTMVPSAEVEYYRKGAGASSNLEKGPDNLVTFRGSKVFESRPFDIDPIGEPRDLLVRERQIGSYYLFPNESDNIKGDKRDIFIYSMDDDDMVRMRYAECEKEAKLNAAAAGVDTSGKGTVLLLRPFETYNGLSDPHERRIKYWNYLSWPS